MFNWPEETERYQKVAKFVDALFSRIDEFARPARHPKWREASISAVVPGWRRHVGRERRFCPAGRCDDDGNGTGVDRVGVRKTVTASAA